MNAKIQQFPAVPAKYCLDPLALYEAATNAETRNTMLLESAEIDTHAGKQSIIISDAALRITCNGHSVTVEALTDNGMCAFKILQDALPAVPAEHPAKNQIVFVFPPADMNLDEDARLKSPSPFDVLRALQKLSESTEAGQDRVFLGGIFGYDLVEVFEKLPDVPVGANTCPNYVFYLAETFIKVDNKNLQTTINSLVLTTEAKEKERIQKRIFSIKEICDSLDAVEVPAPKKSGSITATVSKDDVVYGSEVELLKTYIRRGDIFQVVPSRSFSLPCPKPSLAYRCLRKSNPSPYMFFVEDREFTVFGASPEISVKFSSDTRTVELYPIAGTRKRGKNADGSINYDLDSRIEFELRQDSKELSEHLMLVDLARNDLARIAEINTRHTSALLKVDRYSHVMHLVSHVVAKLRADLDALHAYQACMNMGTLTGAPKIRAAELIRQVERERRGSYGGAVGYICGNGDMDTCILIRSAFVTRDGTAIIQAGGGVVADSIPQFEADESRNKAAAPLSAIAESQGKILIQK